MFRLPRFLLNFVPRLVFVPERRSLLVAMLLFSTVAGLMGAITARVWAAPPDFQRKIPKSESDPVIKVLPREKGHHTSPGPVTLTVDPALRAEFGPIAISPDGKVLAYVLRAPKKHVQVFERIVFLCDIATGKERRRLVGVKEETVDAVVFSPNGRRLAVSMSGETVQLWDWTTGKKLRQWRGWIWPEGNAFSPDGKIVVGGEVNNRKGLVLWEVATNKVVCRFGEKFDPVAAFAFSADGKKLVTEHYSQRFKGKWVRPEDWENAFTVHLWEVSTGKHLGQVGAVLKP
jgi:WD40 repeat protein